MGDGERYPCAKVNIEIGKEYKFKHEVVVILRDCPHEVLLGNDLEFFDELYLLAHANGNPDSHVKAITWAKAN